MNRNGIQAAIITLLEAVSGVENVYPYKQRIPDKATFVQMARMQNESRMQFWWVRRLSTQPLVHELRNVVPTCEVHYLHTFSIKLHYSYKDGEDFEEALQTLIDNVLTAFEGQRTISGAAFGTGAMLTLTGIDEDIMYETLMHVASFSITAYDIVQGVEPS